LGGKKLISLGRYAANNTADLSKIRIKYLLATTVKRK